MHCNSFAPNSNTCSRRQCWGGAADVATGAGCKSDRSTQDGSLAPAGKLKKVDTHKRWRHFWKKQTSLAEVYSVAVLNGHTCHITEHSQWWRFWRLKDLLEKTQLLAAMPCSDTPSHINSHRANKMESTIASHVYICYSWTIPLCTPKPSCRQTVETMSLSHGRY